MLPRSDVEGLVAGPVLGWEGGWYAMVEGGIPGGFGVVGSRAKRWMKSRGILFWDHGGSFFWHVEDWLLSVRMKEASVPITHRNSGAIPPDRALIELERFLGPNARIGSTVQGRPLAVSRQDWGSTTGNRVSSSTLSWSTVMGGTSGICYKSRAKG